MNSQKSKYCNCQISSNATIFNQNVEYSFCQKCSCILIKSFEGDIHYILKHKHKQEENGLDPINIIKIMKKRTEEAYPNIYNLYNTDAFGSTKNEKSFNTYSKIRKKLILKLQKLMKIFNFYDTIFYETLFLLDTYLSKDITEDMSLKKILYYLIGYFLCVSKIKEIDINEPSLDTFIELEKGIFLSPSKIVDYEIRCIKRINYNLFIYSSYDWMMILFSNGVIFNNEIKNNNDIILVNGHRHSIVNVIKKYAFKLLFNLTIKPIFFKFAPMYLALSLIQLSREKHIESKMIQPKLFIKLINLYGVNYADYQKYYEEIKMEINKENKMDEEDKENKNGNEINKIDKENNIKIKIIRDNNKKNSLIHSDKTFNIFDSNKNLFMAYQKRSRSLAFVNMKKKMKNELTNDKDEKNNEKNIDNMCNSNHYDNSNEQNIHKLNNISKIKSHLVIDCSIDSKNPFISKGIKEKKLLPKFLTKHNILLSSEINEEKNDLKTINIRLSKRKHLSSIKLSQINLCKLNDDKDCKLNKFEQNKQTSITGNNRRNFKFNSNRNLFTGISLH